MATINHPCLEPKTDIISQSEIISLCMEGNKTINFPNV